MELVGRLKSRTVKTFLLIQSGNSDLILQINVEIVMDGRILFIAKITDDREERWQPGQACAIHRRHTSVSRCNQFAGDVQKPENMSGAKMVDN